MTFTPVWNRGLQFIIFGNQSTLWLQAIWGQLAGKSSHQRKTLLVWEPPAPNLRKWNARKMKSSQRPLMKGGSRQSPNSLVWKSLLSVGEMLRGHKGKQKSQNTSVLFIIFLCIIKMFPKAKGFPEKFLLQACFKPKPKPSPHPRWSDGPSSCLDPGDPAPVVTRAEHLIQGGQVCDSETLTRTLHRDDGHWGHHIPRVGVNTPPHQASGVRKRKSRATRGKPGYYEETGTDPQRKAGMSSRVATEGQREQFQSPWTPDVLYHLSPLVHGTIMSLGGLLFYLRQLEWLCFPCNQMHPDEDILLKWN